MGWRDRDYARWTDDERRRYLGSGAPRRSPSPPGPRIGVAQGTFLAISVSAVVFLLGHFPPNHPLVAFLNFHVTVPHSTRRSHTSQINLGSDVATVGSHLALHGSVPSDGLGQVTVEGSWDESAWRVLAVTDGSAGSYDAKVTLDQPGDVRIRVVFANGDNAVGSLRVR